MEELVFKDTDNSYPIRIAGQVFGKTYHCSTCGEEVTGFSDRASAREFRVTGLCQDCQDKVFGKEYDRNLNLDI